MARSYMDILMRETLIRELTWAFDPWPFGTERKMSREEAEQKATEIVDRLETEGKLMEFLEKTMPEPCPECGR